MSHLPLSCPYPWFHCLDPMPAPCTHFPEIWSLSPCYWTFSQINVKQLSKRPTWPELVQNVISLKTVKIKSPTLFISSFPHKMRFADFLVYCDIMLLSLKPTAFFTHDVELKPTRAALPIAGTRGA